MAKIPEDRRSSLRYPCNFMASCLVGNDRLAATTRDLSESGICLVVADAEFMPPKQLLIELPAELGDHRETVQVVHHKRAMEKTIIGGAFKEPILDEAKLARLALPVRPAILVIEEEEGVRRLLTLAADLSILSAWPVASGLDAITVLRRHPEMFALALVDVGMTGMDGVQTLAALHTLKPDLDCWFLTAGCDQYTKEELLGFGVSRVVEKPFEVMRIVNEMRMACHPSD